MSLKLVSILSQIFCTGSQVHFISVGSIVSANVKPQTILSYEPIQIKTNILKLFSLCKKVHFSIASQCQHSATSCLQPTLKKH